MSKTRKHRSLAPLPLALICTAAYLVVGGAVGALVLDSQRPARTVVAQVTSTPAAPLITTTSTSSPPPSTTTPPPAGFRFVDAPGGLVTAIPEAWRIGAGTVSTTLVARDPADPRREIRLGGAPVTDPSRTLLDRITTAAVERERDPDHVRVALTGTRIREFPAVRWEFEDVLDGNPTRVGVDYWETAGIEYVLYAAGPPDEWPTTQALLTTMTDTARP